LDEFGSNVKGKKESRLSVQRYPFTER
jgi:hypothetical protein